MTTALQPCPSCSRHIRVDEEHCPFCSAPVAGQLSAAAPRPRGRLSRAALLAASTLAMSPLACGGSTESDEGNKGSGGDTSSGGSGGASDGAGGELNEQPVYGAPATGGDGQGDGGSSATGGGNASGGDDQVGPVYGLPPTE